MPISTSARIWVFIVACILIFPTAAIPLQSTASLEQFHNRTLNAWPGSGIFWSDPSKYFGAVKKWLADRAYPIIQTSLFQKEFLLSVLDTPPQRRVTMAGNGFIFLNGTDEEHLNNIFDLVCILAPSQEIAKRFQDALAEIASFAQAKNLPIDVIAVPTLETLYGDRLPLSVPSRYRSACAERSAGNSPLTKIQSSPRSHYLFPLEQMHAHRDEEGFFPQANWHPLGLSLAIVRDAYLKQLGTVGPIDEQVRLTTGPSELLLTYGIYRYLPVFEIRNQHVEDDAATNILLQRALAPLFNVPRFVTHAFRNSQAPDPETLLLLSDSFGDAAAAVFSGGFQRLLHITTNDMKPREAIELLSRVSKIAHFDRVALLIQEGNVFRIMEYGQEFHDALPSPPHE